LREMWHGEENWIYVQESVVFAMFQGGGGRMAESGKENIV